MTDSATLDLGPSSARAGGPASGKRLIPKKAVLQIVPVSVMTLWRWQRQGIFPPPIKINGRNFWESTSIQAWIETQCATADKSGAPTIG